MFRIHISDAYIDTKQGRLATKLVKIPLKNTNFTLVLTVTSAVFNSTILDYVKLNLKLASSYNFKIEP